MVSGNIYVPEQSGELTGEMDRFEASVTVPL